jgi:hypothetical protein
MSRKVNTIGPGEDAPGLASVIAAMSLFLRSGPNRELPSGGRAMARYPTAGIPRTPDGKPNLIAPAPKALDGKPDLSGLGLPTRAGARIPPGEESYASLQFFMAPGATIPPMLPEAEALYRQRFENFGAGRPSEHCMPHGIPDAMIVPGPVKFVQNPGVTYLLYEEFNHFRQVFTDGCGFPRDMTPAWFGYSIGKWDGDAFVVDTVGFNDQTWLDDAGHPHTDQLHTTERFRRRDLGHMEAQVTIDDPKAYTKPWTVSIQLTFMPDTEMIEDLCDNEKDARREVGK